MLTRTPFRWHLQILIGIALAFGSSAGAADHFGRRRGGFAFQQSGFTQKNVLFFQRLLSDTLGSGTASDVLFADGLAGSRDLQFLPADDPPRLNVLLGRLFGEESEVYDQYRSHKLPSLRGPSTRAGLEQWFANASHTLGKGDRLFIYFTGHGGPPDREQNTTISMWCERPMRVSEFTALLDRLSPQVQVVLVMVQCHSGGFANVIFKDGKAGSELSPARRCGFFATTFNRNAAGCTPDTAEEDYKDYSTYFFAALDGKSRSGQPIADCDLDGDGHVSFAEAHAYTLIHSDTIDIPVTTSDASLCRFSRTGGVNLADPAMPYADLSEKASVTQKAVLKELSRQLNLSSDDRFDEAKRVAELIRAQRKTVERDETEKTQEANKLAQKIKLRLFRRWPELSNPWHPRVARLMTDQGANIQQAIEGDSDYPRWDLLHRDADRLFDQSLDLERRWAKCQRFTRLLETIALADNLEKIAKPPIVQRYRQLLDDEAGILSR